jgi:hypothetical protein
VLEWLTRLENLTRPALLAHLLSCFSLFNCIPTATPTLFPSLTILLPGYTF